MNNEVSKKTIFRPAPAVAAIGRFVPLESSPQSRHADILIGTVNGRSRQVGVASAPWPGGYLLKRVGLERKLAQAECLQLAEGLMAYRKLLIEDCGWSLPQQYELMLHREGAEWHLWILEEYVRALSLQAFMESPRYSEEMRIAAIGSLITTILSHPRTGSEVRVDEYRLPIMSTGVDAKPSNLLVSDEGRLILVDQFPPLMSSPTGAMQFYSKKLHTFSEEKLAIVCFTGAGVLCRMLRLLQLGAKTRQGKMRLTKDFLAGGDGAAYANPEWRILKEEVSRQFPLLQRLYGQ